MSSRNQFAAGNTLALISIFLFAAGFPAAEVLLEIWHPVTLMFFRLILAVSTLVMLWILIEGISSVLKAPWLKGIKIGLLGFGLGTNYISIDLGWGVLMALASGFCFMWASDKSVTRLSEQSSIARSSITFTGAAVFTTISFLVFFALGLIEIPDWVSRGQLFNLIIYSVVAMAVSQIFFIAAIDKVGIAVTSLHLNFSPFYVMIILFLFGGTWDLRAIVGACIVAFGVWLAQLK